MRTISKSRKHFHGTHKGATIEIEREPAREPCGPFYITVTWKDGGHLYDGWAPDHVRTMADAKREALYGSCLKARPPADHSVSDGAMKRQDRQHKTNLP